MLNSAITSVAISAAMPKSAPVAFANNTVLRVAPCKISSIDRPLRANISIASAASVVLTFRLGSIDKSVIKSLNGCISSIVLPVTDAMLASCCSKSAALRTPPANATPAPATAVPIAAIAPTTPTVMVFCKLPNATSIPVVFLFNFPRESVTSLMADDALFFALIRMSSVAIVISKKGSDRYLSPPSVLCLIASFCGLGFYFHCHKNLVQLTPGSPVDFVNRPTELLGKSITQQTTGHTSGIAPNCRSKP